MYDRKDALHQRAKREGYRSRAAYKLLELQKRTRVLRRGQVVVDLGAWPGGWLQVAADLVGSSGRVVGDRSRGDRSAAVRAGDGRAGRRHRPGMRGTDRRRSSVGRPTSCSPTWHQSSRASDRATPPRSSELADATRVFAAAVLRARRSLVTKTLGGREGDLARAGAPQGLYDRPPARPRCHPEGLVRALPPRRRIPRRTIRLTANLRA